MDSNNWDKLGWRKSISLALVGAVNLLGVCGVDILSRRGLETRLSGSERVRVMAEFRHGGPWCRDALGYSGTGVRPLAEFNWLVCKLVAPNSCSLVCERIRLRCSSRALIYSASLHSIYLFSVLTHA